jgi:plastocyanin
MSKPGLAGRLGRARIPVAMVTVTAVAGLALTACSGSGSGGPSGSAGGASTSTVTIENFAFSPDHDTVSPGEKVTVKNQDSVVHTLTSNSGAFNSGPIMPHQSRTITAPSKSGSYPYKCSIHQYMTGTLTVR